MDLSTSTFGRSEQLFLFVFISLFVSFGVCVKSNFQKKISARVNQKKIESSSKEYVTKTQFKFRPTKNIFQQLWANKSLVMACLQNCENNYRSPLFVEFIQT